MFSLCPVNTVLIEPDIFFKKKVPLSLVYYQCGMFSLCPVNTVLIEPDIFFKKKVPLSLRILSMCNVQSVSSKYSIDRTRYILQEESSS